MRRIAILGSTGSIGRSTLSVVESYPARFQIVALAAGSNIDAALEQALRWKPRVLSVAREQDADALRQQLKARNLGDLEVVSGPAGAVRVSTHPDVDFVVSAIVGVAGLEATYEAVKAGKTLGLANKECLVAAGELITAEAKKRASPCCPSTANITLYISACAAAGWTKSSASGSRRRAVRSSRRRPPSLHQSRCNRR